MKPLFSVSHGSAEDIESEVDAFARFYREAFRERAFAQHVKERQAIYLITAVVSLILFVIGVVPIFIMPSSIFAVLLLVMALIMLIVFIFSLVKYKNMPKACEQSFPGFLEQQFYMAKKGTRAVAETIFFENHVESRFASGDKPGKSVPGKSVKRYEDIPCVYETADLYYFQKFGWISKKYLTDEDQTMLLGILERYFPDDRLKYYSMLPEEEE